MEQQQKAEEKPTGGPGGRVQAAEQHPPGKTGIRVLVRNESIQREIKSEADPRFSRSLIQTCSICKAARRADHSDIKMTKTRRQAGDSGAAARSPFKDKVPNPAEVEILRGLRVDPAPLSELINKQLIYNS